MAEKENTMLGQPNTIEPIATPQPPTPTIVTQAPKPSDVYSSENVTQTVTSPVQAPDLSDPYGLYDQFMGSEEIKAAQKRASDVQEQINQTQQALRTTTTALENQNIGALGGTGASMNLIGTQVGRARDLTSNELAALSETQQAAIANLSTLQQDAQNRYQIAQQERAQLQDLIRATGGEAGISFTDSYESALQKAQKYEEEEEQKAGVRNLITQTYGKAGIKETDSLEVALRKADDYQRKQEREAEKKAEERAKEAQKDALKASIKAELRALGKSTKGLSFNELERKLKKYNKRALEEAERRAEEEWSMEKAKFNKAMAGTGGTARAGSESLKETFEEGVQGINSFFMNVAGRDGYVSPGDWEQAKAQWMRNGFSPQNFNQFFGPFRNPNDNYK